MLHLRLAARPAQLATLFKFIEGSLRKVHWKMMHAPMLLIVALAGILGGLAEGQIDGQSRFTLN